MPITATAPAYDDTPAARLEYPRLVKRPRVASAPKGVAPTVTVSPPTEAKAAAARGGLIKTKPSAKSDKALHRVQTPIKPKVVAKPKPR